MKVVERLQTIIRTLDYGRTLPKHNFQHREFDGKDFDVWLKQGIDGYQQWYQCVDFGNGAIAHVTSPPRWEPNPDLDAGAGMDRFDFIIKRNLPDLKDLRVLDLGCNVGLYSIALAKLGAREVIGVDRGPSIRQRTGRLPYVDLVSQANFVKSAFEILERTAFPITYRAIDFRDLGQLESLGHFDLILALNVVYHELDRAPELVSALSRMTRYLLLQSSLSHPPPISRWARTDKNVEMLVEAGFDEITIDCPIGYPQPVISAKKSV